MLGGKRVFVVVPAFDVEDRVGRVVATVPSFVDGVVVVDDASRDATGERARSAGGARTIVVRHAENRGVGAAIATGYREAVFRGADVIAVMAGDAQMDPDDLAHVVLPVVDAVADYVKGNRRRHPRVREMPFARRIVSNVLGAVSGALLGLEGLGDAQCGYTAISADLVNRLPLDDLWPRYGYPNDLLAWVVAKGGRVAEVPVRPVYEGEASGIRPWHAARAFALVLRGSARARR